MTDLFPVPEPRQTPPGWLAEALPGYDACELGCECAFPALQIEPWTTEQDKADADRR